MITLGQFDLSVAYLIRQSVDIVGTDHEGMQHLMKGRGRVLPRPPYFLLHLGQGGERTHGAGKVFVVAATLTSSMRMNDDPSVSVDVPIDDAGGGPAGAEYGLRSDVSLLMTGTVLLGLTLGGVGGLVVVGGVGGFAYRGVF